VTTTAELDRLFEAIVLWLVALVLRRRARRLGGEPLDRTATVRGNAGILVLLVLLYVGMQGMPAAASIGEEQKLGKTFDMGARTALPLSDDIDVNGYVVRLGQKIVRSLGDQPFSYRFTVVRDGHINAFAVPGGSVYVNAGLLTAAHNDDEVAGVLAHEIAHINAHHLMRQQEATQVLNYATLLGLLLSVVHPAIGAGAAAMNSAVQLKYRREFEQEADYLGAGYMQQAGYEPRGMVDFFKKMLEQQRFGPNALPPYLLSHPLTDARITHLEAVLHRHHWDRQPRQPMSADLARVQLLLRVQTEPADGVVASYWKQAAARPDDGQARYLLGLAYFATGSLDAARETFETVPQPGGVDATRELGRTWLRLRQPAKARDLLRQAIARHPEDPLAHQDLAKALEALGANDDAMGEYRRTVQLAPSLEEAHYNLGMLAGRAGRLGEGFYHLGLAFELRGEFDKALSQFKKAQPLLPPGSERAAQLQGRISDLSVYLKHGRLR